MKSKVLKKFLDNPRGSLEKIRSGESIPRAKELENESRQMLLDAGAVSPEEFTNTIKTFLDEAHEQEVEEKQFNIMGFVEERIKMTQQQIEALQQQGADEETLHYAQLSLVADKMFLKQDELFDILTEYLGQTFGYANQILQVIDSDDRFADLEEQYGEEVIAEALAIAEEKQIDIDEALKIVIEAHGNIQHQGGQQTPTTNGETPVGNHLDDIKNKLRK